MLYFLHLPKCGGTTFIDALRSIYPHQRLLLTSNLVLQAYGDNWMSIPVATRQAAAINALVEAKAKPHTGMDVVTGHFDFGWHTRIGEDAQYATIMREPVSRLISHYRYLLDRPTHPHSVEINAAGMSVVEFMESDISFSTDNEMVRRLSGVGNARPRGTCDAALLRLAQDNIEKYFKVVGLTERFDESLALMKINFNWRGVPSYKIRNRSRSSAGDVTKADRERIAAFNQWDVALHAWCEKRFETQLRQHSRQVARSLRLIRWCRHRALAWPTAHFNRWANGVRSE